MGRGRRRKNNPNALTMDPYSKAAWNREALFHNGQQLENQRNGRPMQPLKKMERFTKEELEHFKALQKREKHCERRRPGDNVKTRCKVCFKSFKTSEFSQHKCTCSRCGESLEKKSEHKCPKEKDPKKKDESPEEKEKGSHASVMKELLKRASLMRRRRGSAKKDEDKEEDEKKE